MLIQTSWYNRTEPSSSVTVPWSTCQTMGLFVRHSICLLVNLSVSQSVCLSIWLSICLSVNLSVCQSDCQSVCQSIWLSICQPGCLLASMSYRFLLRHFYWIEIIKSVWNAVTLTLFPVNTWTPNGVENNYTKELHDWVSLV